MPTEIYLVKVGMSMTEGIVEEWYVPDGGTVAVGQLLYRLETEKVNLDVDAEVAGTVKHLVAEGVTMAAADTRTSNAAFDRWITDFRKRALAQGISGAVFEQVHQHLDAELEDLGEQSLKNIPLPVRVFRIAGPASPFTHAPIEAAARRRYQLPAR